MTNKNSKIVSIIVLSVLALVLIGLLGLFIRGGGRFFSSKDTRGMELTETQSYSMDEIEQISLDTEVYDIRIKYSDDDQVHVSQYNSSRLTTTCELSGGTLRVVQSGTWHSWFSFFNTKTPTLEISIPLDYAKSFTAKVDAGSITFENDYSFDQVDLNASAGEVVINSAIKCNNFKASVSAGSIDIESLEAGYYDIRSSVGEIDISYLSGKGKAETSAGSINAKIDKIDESASFTATLGEIDLEIDSSVSFEFNGKKTLGDINADFPVYSDDNGTYIGQVGDNENTILHVEVTTGDADISIS